MSDPKRLDVKGKKPVVAERTLAERKYCAIDQFYYSEMFTCPICYGVERERERIIKLLEDAREAQPCGCDDCGDHVWAEAIELIKGEQK